MLLRDADTIIFYFIDEDTSKLLNISLFIESSIELRLFSFDFPELFISFDESRVKVGC